ncbi:MAG: hypothetical protein PHF98_04580 [Patescibacteria group bacterium]|nr:hypothetical protein [Patescibacteria group bacterium]
MISRKALKLIHSAASIVTILAMIGPFSFQGMPIAQAAGAGSANITGVVTEPDGTTPVAYAFINIHTSTWDYYLGASANEAGAFTFSDVPAGSYILEVWANDDTYIDPPSQTITVPSSGTLDVGTLRLKNPNVTGVVLKMDGVTPVATAGLNLHNSDWSYQRSASTNADGEFAYYLGASGTYTLEVWANDPDGANPPPTVFNFTAGGSKSFTGANALTLQAPSVRGKILLPDGITPAPYANVSVHDEYYAYENSDWVTTDADGLFKTKSLEAGTYTIEMTNLSGAGEGLLAPDALTATVTAGTTNTYYLTHPIVLQEAKKTIRGTVTTPDGTPITDGIVNAWRMDGGMGNATATTDSKGRYSLLVGMGKWQVMVNPTWTDGQPTWGYNEMPVTVKFEQANTIAETKTANFEVTEYTATITGRVLNPNGSIPEMNEVNVNAWNPGGGGGAWGQIDDGGYFSLRVGAGTYQVEIMPNNEEYGAPEIGLITVADGETKNVGTNRLVVKDEFITGKVIDSNGTPLADQDVNAWKATGSGWGWTMTDENGEFTLGVTSGAWFVDVMTGGGSTGAGGGDGTGETVYVRTDPPQKILLDEDETVSNILFELAIADATINGTVQDDSDTVLSDLNAWAEATDANRTMGSGMGDEGYSGLGGEVQNGSFSIKVPAGTYNISVFMPWGSDYTASSATSVTVDSGETYNGAVVTVLPNNATISGSLVDKNGDPVTDVWGEVFADNGMGGNQWAQFEDGTYELNVSAGEWNIGYWTDPLSGYLPSNSHGDSVAAVADKIVTHDLTLLQADSTITGTVLDPDGNPLKNVWVSADTELGGRQSGADDSLFYDPMFNQGNITDANGNFSLSVPEGTYFISASLPPSEGYINPKAQQVSVSPDSPADTTLEFRIADGTITGTVTLDGEPNTAYVWGWSEEGGVSEDLTGDGDYSLNVTKDETWHLGAIYETTTTFYRSDENIIDVPASGEAEQDLMLLETDIAIPSAETATFDATIAKVIKLTDGTELSIPAYSIASEGNVTVTATPKAQVASTATAKPIALAYDFTAKDEQNQTITAFNSNVTIKLPYTDAQLEALGITEDDIMPMYYDDASGTWKSVDNVVIDTENNTISFTANHFTNFGIVTGRVTMQADDGEDHLSVTITKPPTDMTVYAPSVAVEGTVSDASASLTISVNEGTADGVPVGADGSFTSTIQLQPGVNTVALEATSGGGAASASLIITYQTSIDPNADPSTIATGTERMIVTMPDFGAPQVRIFNSDGAVVASFFAYSESLRGEFGITTADINGDGEWEIITYPKSGFPSHIRVFDHEGTLIDDFFAYQETYRGGAAVTAADVDGDANADLVVTPATGSNIRVYTFDSDTNSFTLLDWEMAYGDTFRGHMNVAVSDIDWDGQAEIAAVPASGGGPNVRVYKYDSTGDTLKLIDWFMAYDEEFRGGVNIALANVSGDANKELVVSPASLGGPNVRVYEYDSGTSTFMLEGWFMAYQDTYRGGVNLKFADVNADGVSEIITTPTNGSTNIRIFEDDAAGSFSVLDWFMAYGDEFRGGVTTAITNLDGDEYPEIVTMPASLGGPNVRVYEYDSVADTVELIDWDMAYADTFRGALGATVADLDGDGSSELLIAPTTAGGPNVRVYGMGDSTLAVDTWFMAYTEAFRGGVTTATTL